MSFQAIIKPYSIGSVKNLENKFGYQNLFPPASWSIAYPQNVPASLRYAGNAHHNLKPGSEACVAFCDWISVNDDQLGVNWLPPWDINNPTNYEGWDIRAKQITPQIWETLGHALAFASIRAGNDESIIRHLISKISGVFGLNPIESQILEFVIRDNTDISVAGLLGSLAYTPSGVRPIKFNWVYSLLLGISERQISEAFETHAKLTQNGLLVMSRNPEVFPKSTLILLVRQSEVVGYGPPPEISLEPQPDYWPDWDC
jgi:hypothetical protein